MQLDEADDSFMLLALRRKLKGAAGCLTRTPEAMSYSGLKSLLIEEFGDKLTMAKAERMLRQRKWKRKEESMHQYVLEMKNLRQHMDTKRFTEVDFVDLIINGLGEFDNNLLSLLYASNDLRELKKRMDLILSEIQLLLILLLACQHETLTKLQR